MDSQSSLWALTGGKEKGNSDHSYSFMQILTYYRCSNPESIEAIVLIVVKDLNDTLALYT